MARRSASMFLMIVLVLPAFSALGYETLIVPTEVRHNDRAQAYEGYTLFGSKGMAYLIDLDGRMVHTWNTGANPKLLDNGNVLDTGRNDASGHSGFIELDWNSSLVWQYTEAREGYYPHHDFIRIFNQKLDQPTTLYIANRNITHAQAIAAGCDPAKGPYDGAQLDAIVEVAMNGTVVWEWWFFDHGIQDIDPTKDNYVGAGQNISDYPGRIDLNLPGRPVRKDWLHCNALDYNPVLDQIVTCTVQGELYVIDHGSTFIPGDPGGSIALAAGPKGDFLYRFGDPARYGRGDPPAILEDWTTSTSGHKQMGGVHDVQWIDEGLPGAGDLFIFDNGQYMFERASQSRVLEIDGTLDSHGRGTGAYVDPPAAGYRLLEPRDPENTSKQARLVSNQIVWTYASKSSQDLFSQIGSSAQRLPNGNTLVCADVNGRIFEVTMDGEVVWEYVIPVTATGISKLMADEWPGTNGIFRAYRFGPDHPAFAGRDLAPQNPITGPSPGPDFRPPEGATETFYLDNASAYKGCTLFAANGTTYLVDLEGRMVNTWDIGLSPTLLDNGTLLDSVSTTPGALKEIRMLDWNGSVLWGYAENRPGYVMHHDFQVVRDKELNESTLLYLVSKEVTDEQAIAAGCDPADGPYDGARTDGIVEVALDGRVIWEWWFLDHGIQDVDATKANFVGPGKNISDFPGRINLNLPGRPLGKSWLDCNSIDYSEELDQLVVNSALGEFYVIDHGATFVPGDPAASISRAAGPAGDFLYRFGDPARYGQGAPPSVRKDWTSYTTGDKQLGGSSDVHWIGSGLPGAGHFLAVNTGQYYFERTSQSYIFEIDPYRTSGGAGNGSYVNPPGAGYYKFEMPKDTHKESKRLSNQIVWMYYSKSNIGFFSPSGSSAQRLPNGNTLVCAMSEGHLFEVTAGGTPVWEYINPVTANGTRTLMYDEHPMTNAVYRALRYGADHPALRGRDLTPGATITGEAPAYITPVYLPGGGAPAISGTAHRPSQPTPSDDVVVTSNVTLASGVASVTLTYSSSGQGGTGGETTVFRETMGAAPAKPWTGNGTENQWKTTAVNPANLEQRTQANLGGNPCGLEFGTGTANLTDTMIETARVIDARGNSSYVEFYLWANGLEGPDGWTFQLDSGSGYATRLSELAGVNHDWQLYRYDLQPEERVANLTMRYQFRAGDQGDRIRLDMIYVNVSSGGGPGGRKTIVPMLDDGTHGDGKARDGTFGARIRAYPEGTRVDYFVTAVTSGGAVARDPPGALGATRYYVVGKGAEPVNATGALADTGQTGDYTATFGEDSDYTVNPPLFTDNGDGTVTDNVTGLEWQKADGGEMTWEAARAYADGLSLGGHSDWRLPTGAELFNIMDHGRQDPALDTEYFTKTQAQYYWTGTALVGDAGRVWAANTGGGIGAQSRNETVSAGGNRTFHVRCVRGDVASLQGGSFADNGDGTVTSAATGLVWQRADAPGNLTWEGALAYCEALALGGHDDWRLPNVKELRSISNDTLSRPSISAAAFPGAAPSSYWTSTTEIKDPARAWFVDFGYGLVGYEAKTQGLRVRAVRGGANGTGGIAPVPEMVAIPGGTFEMGDHSGLGDAEVDHPGDELPLHNVTVDGFRMGNFEVTNAQYCDFLNAARGEGSISVSADGVFSADGLIRYCDLFPPNTSSRIAWDGQRFAVTDGRMSHPVTGVRWAGAAAYCNWLGVKNGYAALYDIATGGWNRTAAGYRLPTEAEWEYAALGGRSDPYPVFPWGNEADATRANWPYSPDPYEAGTMPWTTPVGFYDGSLRKKVDFGWPGEQATYQTGNGSNGYGLYDMAGNVWEWVSDLYNSEYYKFSPYINPPGPANATLMPDGTAYHALRGGSWSGGLFGGSRLADRKPGNYRGPQDLGAPYSNIGFRVVLAKNRQPDGIVEPGAGLVKLAGGFGFAEGPAADAAGNIYFTDPTAGRIYIWSVEEKLSIFKNGTGGASGLAFDPDGKLVACEGDNKRVTSVDVAHPAAATVLAAMFDKKPFNRPNDLWMAPDGGIYFTDPVYGNGTLTQDGEHVYYLAPDAAVAVRVVGDMVRPNGLVGTPDGRTLYISDHGAKKTWRYTVLENGSLSGKELFVPLGSDGMTLDAAGNIYLTERTVLVFDPAGSRIAEIAAPERPTNLEFGGSDRHTLFITTEKGFFGIRMAMEGTSNFRPRVLINEIGQDIENGTASGAGKPEFWIELYNNGSTPVDLGGMYLTNDIARPTAWRLPASTTIAAGGFLVVWADDGWVQGALHASFELDAAGGIAALFMRNGVTVVDSLSYGPQSANASFGRYPDGSDTLIFMHDHPSPGGPNLPDDTGGGGGNGKPPVVAPPAVTIGGRIGSYIIVAVVAMAAAVAAGLLIQNRRKHGKGPEAEVAKQQD